MVFKAPRLFVAQPPCKFPDWDVASPPSPRPRLLAISSVGTNTHAHTPYQLSSSAYWNQETVLEFSEVSSHVHVWARLACLTQLCSISGVYCHADTIPRTCTLSHAGAHTHAVYARMYVHLVADSNWASLLRGKSQQSRWSDLSASDTVRKRIAI